MAKTWATKIKSALKNVKRKKKNKARRKEKPKNKRRETIKTNLL